MGKTNSAQPYRKMAGSALVGMALLVAVSSYGQTLPKISGSAEPSAGLMPNPSKGKGLYAQNCASCHGAALQGQENGSTRGPSFLHRVYEPSHHGDAAFQRAVASGAKAHHWKFGDMAPVNGVTPDEVAHITAYIRMMQRKAGIN